MLFDAHARAFEAFGGVPRRGIHDNMKTAFDQVLASKKRKINACFEAMTGHYLFEPEFCNVASVWEKGIVGKNVRDRRSSIWHRANTVVSLMAIRALIGFAEGAYTPASHRDKG